MDIVLRVSAMFVFAFVLLRLLGKRELSQMTPFEFVVLVVLGDFVQQGVTHNDFSLTGAALAVGAFAFWSLLLSWAAFLWPKAERFLEGEPLVLIRDGTLLQKNLTARPAHTSRDRIRDAPRRHRLDPRCRLGDPRTAGQDQLYREEIGPALPRDSQAG